MIDSKLQLASCWTPEAQAIVDAKAALISQNIADVKVVTKPSFTSVVHADKLLNTVNDEMTRSLDLLR